MNHDSDDNPFRKLAKTLAARAREHDRPGPGRKPEPGAEKKPGQTSGQRPGRREDDAREMEGDAALFLDAVRRIKPLKKRGAGGGPSLAPGLDRALARRQVEKTPDSSAAEGGEFARAMARLEGGRGKGGGTPAGETSAASLSEVFRENAADASSGDKEAELFAKAMQGVRPVSGRGRDLAPPADAARPPAAHDPAKALREMLEGKLEFTLQHTDEHMEGFVLGLDALVLARLRAGRYSPEKHLDLHGLNARQAHDALTLFIKDAYQRNMRCVVVVTGRGRNSPDGVGVLRPLLQGWLTREPFKRVVLAFCTARPGDGGPGAVYVLLRKYKKSRGKIIWERTPADDDFPDI